MVRWCQQLSLQIARMLRNFSRICASILALLFTERGHHEKLKLKREDGTLATLIDQLHRILWLIENQPRNLNAFLDEAKPDSDRLRLVAKLAA